MTVPGRESAVIRSIAVVETTKPSWRHRPDKAEGNVERGRQGHASKASMTILRTLRCVQYEKRHHADVRWRPPSDRPIALISRMTIKTVERQCLFGSHFGERGGEHLR
jgi:hypothetical protein